MLESCIRLAWPGGTLLMLLPQLHTLGEDCCRFL